MLDEIQFREIALALNPHRTEQVLQSLLTQVDPHNHQRITFSDCVGALAADLHAVDALELERAS